MTHPVGFIVGWRWWLLCDMRSRNLTDGTVLQVRSAIRKLMVTVGGVISIISLIVGTSKLPEPSVLNSTPTRLAPSIRASDSAVRPCRRSAGVDTRLRPADRDLRRIPIHGNRKNRRFLSRWGLLLADQSCSPKQYGGASALKRNMCRSYIGVAAVRFRSCIFFPRTGGF